MGKTESPRNRPTQVHSAGFLTKGGRHFYGGRIVSTTNGVGTIQHPYAKTEPQYVTHTYTKINSDCITHPNVKHETETTRRKHWRKQYNTESMNCKEKMDILVLIKI